MASLVGLPLHLVHAEARCGSLCVLDGNNRVIDPDAGGSVEVSRYVTNGPTFARTAGYDAASLAPTDIRVQADELAATGDAFAVLESRTQSGALRGSLRVPLLRPREGLPLRSPFVRLVADTVDQQARGVEGRTLLVALRDRIVVDYGDRQAVLRVGRPGNEDGPNAARQVRLSVHILRTHAGGRPVIGRTDTDALEIMRAQIRASNEIWSQCALTFGAASEVAMEIVDPPSASLLAIADDDGLPARGGGEIRLRIGNQSIGPIATQAGAAPEKTAQDITRALNTRGFHAQLSANLPSRASAGPSVDVLVRNPDGSFAKLERDGSAPLSSDAQQSVRIGVVDLTDGLLEFDNMTALVGSLEERSLLKALADDDEGSIDVFVVNQFSNATRQGEAFIAEPGAAIVNAVVIDRNGLRHLPLAWTLAHELGHVLMNDPLHPDNVGPDRPWLLMDADNGRGTVDGPKRLRREDCLRVRRVASGAKVALLLPYDPDATPK